MSGGAQAGIIRAVMVAALCLGGAQEAAAQQGPDKPGGDTKAGNAAGAGKEATDQEAAGNDGTDKDAASKEAASKEAAGKDAASKEAAGKDAANKEAASKEAAGKDAAGKEAADKDAKASKDAPSKADAEQDEAERKRKRRNRRKRRRNRRRRPSGPNAADGWGEDPGMKELQQHFRDAWRRQRYRKRRKRPKSDIRIRLGGGFIGVGGAFFITGLGVYISSLTGGGEMCGLSGCVTTVNHSARLAGESMMISSAVMLAGALPTLLTGTMADEIPIRESEGQLGAGASLTLLGLGGVAGGAAALALEQLDRQGQLESDPSFFFEPRANSEEVRIASISTLVVGSSITLIGIPLWLNGGRTHQPKLHQTPRLGQLPMLPTQLAPKVSAGPASLSLQWRLH